MRVCITYTGSRNKPGYLIKLLVHSWIFKPCYLLHKVRCLKMIFLLFRKIMELEEELKVVGNSLKSLEVSEEKVRTIVTANHPLCWSSLSRKLYRTFLFHCLLSFMQDPWIKDLWHLIMVPVQWMGCFRHVILYRLNRKIH